MVHGQNECDIPTQLPVHEDTQFDALLKVKLNHLVCENLIRLKFIFLYSRLLKFKGLFATDLRISCFLLSGLIEQIRLFIVVRILLLIRVFLFV